MEITLEKIELVKDRTGVSYREAKDALEAAEGSVVDAIIAIEETVDVKKPNKANEFVSETVEKIKELVKKGNISKIAISRDDDTIVNIPVTVGVVGTLVAPWGVIVAAIAAFGFKCKIELTTDEGKVINISEKAEGVANDVKEKSSVVFDEVVAKGTVVVNEVKEKAPGVFDDAVKKSAEAYNNIKDAAAEKFEGLKNKGKDVFEDIEDGLDDVLEDLEDALGKAEDKLDEAKEKAAEAGEKAAEVAEEKVTEIADKIDEAEDKLDQ